MPFLQQCSSKLISGCHQFAWRPVVLLRNRLCRRVAAIAQFKTERGWLTVRLLLFIQNISPTLIG